jgi:hypothetical protein
MATNNTAMARRLGLKLVAHDAPNHAPNRLPASRLEKALLAFSHNRQGANRRECSKQRQKILVCGVLATFGKVLFEFLH